MQDRLDTILDSDTSHWVDVLEPEQLENMGYKALHEIIEELEQRDPLDWVDLNMLETAYKEIANRIGKTKESLSNGEAI